MPESPADTIRRAATLMRERAMAATSGGWESITLPEWDFYEVRADQSPPGRPRTEYRWVGSYIHERADAEYIAALHPTVVLRVADSWVALAEEMADYPAVHVPLGIGIASRPEEPSTLWTHTYNAAVAYLGETP